MDDRLNGQERFSFKNIQLLKDPPLGIGSYGAVYKAKCDDLLCAAKVIHPTLFDPTALHQIAPQREHRLPIRRFEQECEFMSAIRHPNIVQYLGVFSDPETHFPMLLMEFMDDNLTNFLESSSQPIPYHIQVNICHDITLALSFLHSNHIVHRDLSSNNILLRGNVIAKVTDFGMARLGACFTNTVCPGTNVYMPPEAILDKPSYTEKIDCFSFGVIIVQILTRRFPKPGDRLQRLDGNHSGLLVKVVPEIDRRHNHIKEIDRDHPLLAISLDCLKDEDSERPSAHLLCEKVGDLKGMPKFTRSAQDQDRVIQSLESEISSKETEIYQLREEKDQATRQLEERDRQLDQLERRFAELHQQLSQREQQNLEANNIEMDLTSIKLKWREGKSVSPKMTRSTDAVVDGSTVYFKDSDTVNIYSYDLTTDSWSQLPDCTESLCSITVINGLVTTVGGLQSNELFSLTWDGNEKGWTRTFPPMPTKRSNPTALCTETALIVAGGQDDFIALSIVEVMNTENHRWSTAADLPQPMYLASAAVCGDYVYMLGGGDVKCLPLKAAYVCSLSALLQSCATETELERTSLEDKTSLWRQIADLPFSPSPCECFLGQLLVVTGCDMYNSRSVTMATDVYVYNSTNNAWEIICPMTIGRICCFTAVLPDNQLMVVGGLEYSTENQELTFSNKAEFAN